MYGSFYDELEKIALSKGEGSRGGKVVGRTKSGKPIYESSKKEKPNWGRRLAIGGAALGAAALIASAARGKKVSGGGGKKSVWDTVTGAADDAWEAKRGRWDKANRAYKGAYTRGQGKQWKDYTAAGDDYFGKNDKWWKGHKTSQQTRHETWKAKEKSREKWKSAYDKAKADYEKADGPWSASNKEKWKAYEEAGDKYRKGDAWWDYQKANYRYQHSRYKAGERPGGRTAGGSRGSSWGGQGRSSAGFDAAEAAKTKIPGLGKVKTKADAKKAYRAAAMKSHPDKGGSTEKMQEVNAAWESFKNSPLYEKLAMPHWIKLASAMYR